ncbi:glycosyltransferase [Microbacterium sp. CFBP9034]|uniref:glycosyltransferase n=1 Tax=Microbacterium sp. CFBP9034 TaxID=3096540 RepID=UPI002A6ADDE3|nr:glycosyltransferase [Microbacterium sp. CFBP9034]MDY0908783.1 glycosyltransferase [Microbacterium sp. CFBP9034]
MKRRAVEAMVVVVPVRNEAELLGASLVALASAVDAAREAQLRCEVRIVLDACTDSSAEVAAASDFEVLHCDAARVGAARRLGIAAALRAVDDLPADRVWIANTDADSRVPADWLTHQHALSRAADIWLGTVRPDFDDLSSIQREHWVRTHARGRTNRNIHGANLGLRAQSYIDAGGFASIGEHEDVDLVTRCRALGSVAVGSDEAEVITSGRFVGRAPGGYADFLRRQAVELVEDPSRESGWEGRTARPSTGVRSAE